MNFVRLSKGTEEKDKTATEVTVDMAVTERDGNGMSRVAGMVVEHVSAGLATAANNIAGSASIVATFLTTGLTLIGTLQEVFTDDASQQQVVVPTLKMRARQPKLVGEGRLPHLGSLLASADVGN